MYLSEGSRSVITHLHSLASAFLRQMEGQTLFQQLIKKLDVVLQIIKKIPWALLYLMAISIAHFQDYRFPFDFSYEILDLWCLWIFFSYRVLSTLPTWHSFMPDMVRSAVRRAWSKARDVFRVLGA
jgi:hypothetical protein